MDIFDMGLGTLRARMPADQLEFVLVVTLGCLDERCRAEAQAHEGRQAEKQEKHK
jgi:hypothetical protein